MARGSVAKLIPESQGLDQTLNENRGYYSETLALNESRQNPVSKKGTKVCDWKHGGEKKVKRKNKQKQ